MRGNHGGPFGAVVVRSGKLSGAGWNQVTSTNDPTAHAEIIAIRDACRRLKTFRLDDCELYASCERVRCVWRRVIGRGCGKFITPTPGGTRQRFGFDDEMLLSRSGAANFAPQDFYETTAPPGSVEGFLRNGKPSRTKFAIDGAGLNRRSEVRHPGLQNRTDFASTGIRGCGLMGWIQ